MSASFIGLTALPFLGGDSTIETFQRGGIIAFYLLLLSLAGVVAILNVILDPYHSHISDFLPALLAVIVLLAWILLVSKLRDLSVLDSNPLKREIAAFTEASINIPTYAATAAQVEVFDPDNPTWLPIVRGPDEPPLFSATTKAVFVPRYVRLDQASTEERTRAVLASAALPFGLTPSIQVDDENRVDGGVVDNLPIYPLICVERCRRLLVIRLRVKSECDLVNEGVLRRHVATMERLPKLQDYPLPSGLFGEPTKRRDPPSEIPFAEPPFWPLIDPVYPSTPLGSILDFREKHLRAILAQGRATAEAFLSAHPEYLPKDLSV